MVNALAQLAVSGSVLMIDDRPGELTLRAARNVPGLRCSPASTLNIIDVLDHDVLLFSVEGIRSVERMLSDGNA
jgi:large subunit ribosomal protein L4